MVDKVSQYNFLFHPFAKEHSEGTKAASVITVIALSILTASLYFWVFLGLNLRDRLIKRKKGPTKESQVAQSHLLNQPKPVATPSQTISPQPVAAPLQNVSVQKEETTVEKIKQEHRKTLKAFENHCAKGDWNRIRSMHYDWWMFPINRDSRGYGKTYTVSDQDVATLRADPQFMTDYRRGVQLVMLAWGWDTEKKQPANNGQTWDNYQVRLGKILHSLTLFEEKELHDSVDLFIQEKISQPLEQWIQRYRNG